MAQSSVFVCIILQYHIFSSHASPAPAAPPPAEKWNPRFDFQPAARIATYTPGGRALSAFTDVPAMLFSSSVREPLSTLMRR
jgi:hypothetical protein